MALWLVAASAAAVDRIFVDAGAGVTFGDRQQYEVGLRAQHVSNADIK